MFEALDLELRWPELFEGLTSRQRRSVVQAYAANWHEGWNPNEFDVKNLTDVVRGTITRVEYFRRCREKVSDDRRRADETRRPKPQYLRQRYM